MFKQVNEIQAVPLLLIMANLNIWLKDCYPYGFTNSTSLKKTYLPSEKHSPFLLRVELLLLGLPKDLEGGQSSDSLCSQRESSRKLSKLHPSDHSHLLPWRGAGKEA